MVETIGRDTTLIIKDPTDNEKTFRAIVDASHRIKPGDDVSLSIKSDKLYIFNKETGELL
jgi:predicted transcriptional regulator